jgi:predicted permease
MADWEKELRLRLSDLKLDPMQEAEIVEEFSLRLEDRFTELLAQGATEIQAKRIALDELLKDLSLFRELQPGDRAAPQDTIVFGADKKGRMIAQFLQDIRYAMRSWRKNPGVALLIVLTLALGIGANTAMFSVIYGALLRPLPYPEPDRLMLVQMTIPKLPRPGAFSVADYLDWRGQNESFEEIAVYGNRLFNLSGEFPAEQIQGVIVSPGFFSVLGVKPLLGGVFSPEMERGGDNRIVILSQKLWERRFGADPQIIGRPITLNEDRYTVIGVLPDGFKYFNDEPGIWTAFASTPPTRRGPFFLTGLGRLRPGMSSSQAVAELKGIRQSGFGSTAHVGFVATPLRDHVIGNHRKGLLLLLGAVGLVLLIALVNVANLQLARAAGRQREIAIRSAMGASRGRLMRQLLTESLLLASAGGLLGLALAFWGIELLKEFGAAQIPRLHEIGLDLRMLGFTAVASLFCGFGFGLAPALQVAGIDLNQMLNESGRSLGQSAGQSRWRNGLVALEVAMAVVLLVGAGLLMNSLIHLHRAPLGFQPEQLLTMQIAPTGPRYNGPEPIRQFYRDFLDRVSALPGVESAAYSMSLPPNLLRFSEEISVEGAADQTAPVAPMIPISPGFFHTLGAPLLAGRTFNDRDTGQTSLVAIVNEALARRYFPGQNPIGKRVRQGGPDRTFPWMEIVGVVGDLKYRGLHTPVEPVVYRPFAQMMLKPVYLAIRSRLDESDLIPAAQNALRSIDPTVPAANIRTMPQLMSEAVSEPRFRSSMLGLFAFLALALSMVGVYGVTSYTVGERIHEMGVRIALGAQTRDILSMVLKRGMSPVLIGLAVGLSAALALTRLIESELFEIGRYNPWTLCTVSFGLLGAALLACWRPARRATEVDPMRVLKCD